LLPDITLAVRLEPDNQTILDYYIFPSIDLSVISVRLLEQNASGFDIYRFNSPLPLFGMAERFFIGELAA
jgi:hypothetical protein